MMSYTTPGTDPKTPISYHKDIFTSTFIDALFTRAKNGTSPHILQQMNRYANVTHTESGMLIQLYRKMVIMNLQEVEGPGSIILSEGAQTQEQKTSCSLSNATLPIMYICKQV